MFRHKGKRRTFKHNLRLASILSFIAGTVNIIGVLLIKTLTTNVTGHFAYFSEELLNKNYAISIVYLLFIISFLVGAFTSNLLIEFISRIKPKISFAIPIIMEIIILVLIGLFGTTSHLSTCNGQIIACSLLFAMGLQNSLVTQISHSVVRTTHLTGLFTDLGIELSQLFFYYEKNEFKQLTKSIYLKLAIISCFFLGCILGGVLYQYIGAKTLFVTSLFLIFALFYDNILFQYYHFKRKLTFL